MASDTQVIGSVKSVQGTPVAVGQAYDAIQLSVGLGSFEIELDQEDGFMKMLAAAWTAAKAWRDERQAEEAGDE